MFFGIMEINYIGRQKIFLYDNLRRLKEYSNTARVYNKVDYNDNGNITSKTEPGQYSCHNSKKQAVEEIENTEGLIKPWGTIHHLQC